MAASWPVSVKTFTTKNNGDIINPAHINDMQDEIAALEGSFLNGQWRASAYNNAVQSLSDSTPAALTFNSEDFDTGSFHDTGSNTSRLVVPSNAGGAYLIIGGTTFATNATGYRSLKLRKNGSTDLTHVFIPDVDSNIATVIQLSFIAILSAADYVELLATQTSGGALNAGSASRDFASFLQMARLW